MKEINLKNKNSFLITCISCIVLLLVMCYFGINTDFKGTSAVDGNCPGQMVGGYCCPAGYTSEVQEFENSYATSDNGHYCMKYSDSSLIYGEDGSTLVCRVTTNSKTEFESNEEWSCDDGTSTSDGTTYICTSESLSVCAEKTYLYNIEYDLVGGSYGTYHPSQAYSFEEVVISPAKKTIKVNIVDNADATITGVDTATAEQTFKGWIITAKTGTISNAEYFRSATPYGQYVSYESGSVVSALESKYKNLNTFSGGITLFQAQWDSVSFNLPKIEKSGYNCYWGTTSSLSTAKIYESGAVYTPTATEDDELELYGFCTESASTYKVSFYENGKLTSSQTCEFSLKEAKECDPLTPCIMPEDYYACDAGAIVNPNPKLKWYSSSSCSGDEFNFLTNEVMKDMSLYTCYEEITTPSDSEYVCFDGPAEGRYWELYGDFKDNVNYNYLPNVDISECGADFEISYNANGGSGTMENTVCTYGEGCTLNKNLFTYGSATFMGWSINSEDTSIEYEDQAKFDYKNAGDLKLFAVWKFKEYTGKFMNGDDVFDTKTCTAKDGGTCDMPVPDEEPSKSGSTFDGWSTSSSCKNPQKSAFKGISADDTYYACFTENEETGGGSETTPSEKTYTGKFMNGDDVFDTKTCTAKDGGTCDMPVPDEEPSMKDHKFQGWSTSNSCTSMQKTAFKNVSANNTYYACFIKNPGTNDSAIKLVWAIGLFVLGYSVIYYKKAKQN